MTSASVNYTADIAYKNKFRTITKNILKKIEDYKEKSQIEDFDMTQLENFFQNKITSKKGEYYDFFNETDEFILKILIQFLYEELENCIKTSKKKQHENMNKIKNMQKTLNDYEKIKISPKPFLKEEIKQEIKPELKQCLEKLTQFNDLFRNIKQQMWQILNDDIEYEKIKFKNDKFKKTFVETIEEIYDKINKTLENNIFFLQSFSILDYSELDNDNSFDEISIINKTINSLEVKKNHNTQENENLSPLKNILNSPIVEKSFQKNEVETQIIPNESLFKSNLNEDYKNLYQENFHLKLKIEQLRKEFSKISSYVIQNMNERDIHSKKLLSENEQLLRSKNINNLDFQALEKKYQNKLEEQKKEIKYYLF